MSLFTRGGRVIHPQRPAALVYTFEHMLDCIVLQGTTSSRSIVLYPRKLMYATHRTCEIARVDLAAYIINKTGQTHKRSRNPSPLHTRTGNGQKSPYRHKGCRNSASVPRIRILNFCHVHTLHQHYAAANK